MTHRTHKMLPLFLLASAMVFIANGCSMIKTPSYLEWLDAKNRPQEPTRITSYWNAYALTTEGKSPQRALAGRVMFYNNDSTRSIKVDGTVTFFVFDAKVTDPENAKPLFVYEFTPERVKSSYSESELGHSYSFLIPFDDLGSPEMEVLIQSRIDTVEEKIRVIAQEPSRLYLPGKSDKKPLEMMQAEESSPDADPKDERIASESNSNRQESENTEDRSIQSETINLSSGMQQRLGMPLSPAEREQLQQTPLSLNERMEASSTLHDSYEEVKESRASNMESSASNETDETILYASERRGPAPRPTPTVAHSRTPVSPSGRN